MSRTSRSKRRGRTRQSPLRNLRLPEFPVGTGGVALIFIGALSIFGLYLRSGGVLGRALITGGEVAFGRATYLIPVLLIIVGIMIVVESFYQLALRTFACSMVAVISVCALLQLIRGPDRISSDAAAFRVAGGYAGAITGIPMSRFLSDAGAGTLLVVIFVIALLALLDLSVHNASSAAGRGILAVIGSLRNWFTHLFRLENRNALRPYFFDAEASADFSDEDTIVDVRDEEDEIVELPDEAEPEFVEDLDEVESEEDLPIVEKESVVKALHSNGKKPKRKADWKLPSLDLLKKGTAQRIDTRVVEAGGRALEEALEAHGVDAQLIDMVIGPTVTRYELELAPGVKVSKVTSLNKDIAYAMASPDVRILAPIPGKSAIGIEVPNRQRSLVTLHDILQSDEAKKATTPLEVGLGRDISGKAVLANMATMPHILVAGATGAGKSSSINSIVMSILMRSTPDQVRLILVDPKRVELGHYNAVPHLLSPVVVNPKKAANALAWAVKEMERRYDLMAEVGVRDIAGYNASHDRGDLKDVPGGNPDGSTREYQRLPLILIVVDELNDLMMVAARDVENSITRIAQMARAVGIHLVVATQRPSVDVITGVIKANIPSRLAFAVSSQADSRVILDQLGAERLIGQGDMLLLTASSSNARRIQGAWVSEDEIRTVTAFWKRQAQPDYVDGVDGDGETSQGSMFGDSDDDELLDHAMELVVRSQLGSTSMLQRKLRVGFARAGRLMDLLEQRGIVGPSEGSKPRAVLMSPDELEALQAKN